jgi:hypothetical protein
MENNLCKKCYIQENKIKLQKIESSDEISFENFKPKYFSSKNELRNALLQFIPTITNYIVFNKEGYTIFHWYSWYISTNTKKYADERIKYIWFFECLKELLPKKIFYELLTFGTINNKKWTVLHHLVDNCVNVNVKHIQNFIKFLLESGLNMNMEDDEGITPNIIIQRKNIKNIEIEKIGQTTKKYKELENMLKSIMLLDYSNNFSICIRCNSFVSYLLDLREFSKYLNNNLNEKKVFLEKNQKIIKEIIENREILSKLFNNFSFAELEEVKDSNEQHNYVIELYKSFL